MQNVHVFSDPFLSTTYQGMLDLLITQVADELVAEFSNVESLLAAQDQVPGCSLLS